MNDTLFLSFVKPDSITSYLLGYLWADGHVKQHGRNKRVTISVAEDDGEYLKEMFLKTGDWCVYVNPRRHKNNQKRQIQIYKQNISLFNWLVALGFDRKSTISPDGVLSKIPRKFHHLFWRGYIDGDGCFYNRPSGKSPEFCISSTFHQNWGAMKRVCRELGISKYKVRKRIHKLGRGSVFEILRRDDIRKLGEYVYKDYDGCVGLRRKFEKYQSIQTYHTQPGRKKVIS